jgi:hypothetical protein
MVGYFLNFFTDSNLSPFFLDDETIFNETETSSQLENEEINEVDGYTFSELHDNDVRQRLQNR